ncbi:MAG TPA: cytochrome c peroxidase [Planctomycetota bacterium]|nr:cytochrome c peroxidase [Planctomycetota bacterium]
MNMFAANRLLVVLAWCAAALPAQKATPRFFLPDVPYDYAPLAAPGLAAHFSLPGRNGTIPNGGCGPLSSTPPAPPPPDRTNELATLGRVLFHDPLLSRNQTRSCASCHQQSRAFADGHAHSRGFGGRSTRRNSMSIANLGQFVRGFFWDARAETLEKMVVMPIQDPIEMGMDLPGVLARLRTEPGYAELFARAFGDPAIDERRLAEALAQFVRSIVSLRSSYDEGLAATGDVDKDFPNFTAAENRGKKLFFGDAGTRPQSCAACHVERVFAWCGNSFFIDPVSLQTDCCRNNGVDLGRASDDAGLGNVTGKAEDRGKFRAPSLRNVELTGPYMHDGRFATLEQVMQFYSDRVLAHPNLDEVLRHDAGKSGWGQPAGTPAPVDLTMGMAPAQRLGVPLSSRERADLVAFLKTLTDWELVRDPRFADPFVRRRAP